MEQRYDYICFCDVTNYASPGVNPLYIGWLTKHQGVKIVAGVKGMEKEEVKVGVEKEFVVSGRQFGDIIMKVSLFGEMRMR
jgi:glycerol-3-phosphate responsive antiterminator